MSIKLIVTDLDNTLLRRDKTISEYTQSVFRRVHERGILLAFATGRPLSDVTDYAELLSPVALIISNGSRVYADGELIAEYIIPNDTANAVLKLLIASPATFRISVRTSIAYYSSWRDNPNPEAVYSDFSTPLNEPIFHFSTRSDDDSLIKEIAVKYPELDIYKAYNQNLYDFNASNATKPNGVKLLAERYGIQLSDTAAFGDDSNDIEMLQVCGIGVAVSNAIDAAKLAANYVCGDCDDDGIARWIEENILPNMPNAPRGINL
ncbi:MAG: Cof-type HAD-IIB family hydrolase [Oscillospiraceae bacterium]|jgi:Cof subfamily protein (haloacid dehalogenase superfamily)|nr:Cof-type HAD-IIB family hydrolase [Oscillospiraceae bacterium]